MTASDQKPLTGRMRADGAPVALAEYERAGGYQAARQAIASMAPKEITEAVTKSNLRGRGGGGFPTGKKWSFVPLGKEVPNPTYLVINGDEMEPGTFKDRLLMERDPHQLLEGALISGFAVEADIAFIFLRGEYVPSANALQRAIGEAYEAHYLGKNVFGSGYSLDVYLHLSAGRYMCGEETGMLNALEGKRANPRSKPPYPVTCGLFGKPTVVNNVETICCVPHIIRYGADGFRALSRTADGGTKLFGASGKVRHPGLWELPMGTPIRQILEDSAGGMRDGVGFRALQPGGASTDFVVEKYLDTPMDFTALSAARSRLGTGTMIVLDDQTCPVGMVANLTRFFARESCGWCTPCWSGLNWAARILDALENGQGNEGHLERLAGLAGNFGSPGNTFCALAPGAAAPITSALEHFRDDFERHIREKRCPWR